MPNATNIEWADLTINPTRGCSHCSPGCDNCYAERFAARLAHNPQTAHAYAGLVDEKGKWTGKVSPLHDLSVFHRLPKKPCRIFVGSMTDMFHPALDDNEGQGMRAMLKLFGEFPQHTFMLLTKRPERMRRYIEWIIAQDGDLPPNLWIGVTVCNQAEADTKIPVLLQTPAAKRFVSIEPMLGPVDLTHMDADAAGHQSWCWINSLTGRHTDMGRPCSDVPKLDWVICGGETGSGARPMHPDWVRSLRDQCKAAEVPFFFKSWGEWGATAYRLDTGLPSFGMFESFIHYCNKAPTWMHKGDKLICPDGHIPTHGAEEGKSYPMCIVRRVGKKRAGRLLDGREWNEVPL